MSIGGLFALFVSSLVVLAPSSFHLSQVQSKKINGSDSSQHNTPQTLAEMEDGDEQTLQPGAMGDAASNASNKRTHAEMDGNGSI